MAIEVNNCLVLEMKRDGRLPHGKHESHEPHVWWFDSWGGGHQLSRAPASGDNMNTLWKYYCPGGEINGG